MKEQILKLRQQGKSYREIAKILGCSKATVSYHLSEGQKEKSKARQQQFRKENVFVKKTEHFKNRKRLRGQADDFQRERKGRRLGKRNINFTYKDVVDKFGNNPVCYLTGRTLDLTNSRDCHFDHIVPVSRGGDNSLENLGIVCGVANRSKNDMTMQEFLLLCKEILEHHGYTVEK